MSTRTLIVVLAVLLIVSLGIAYYVTREPRADPTNPTPTSTATSTPTAPPAAGTSRIELAMLDTAGTTNGAQRGCDRVVMVPITIATTTAPLTAAMRELFALSTTSFGGYYNFIDRTRGTLSFDRATVESGTANIYLRGSLSGLAGVCDDPRTRIQIEETALQFPTVERVQLFLNGATSDLTPSQQ